jgi:hypothetical protein
MPYLFKVTYGGQTKRLSFQGFPRFLNLHNRVRIVPRRSSAR